MKQGLISFRAFTSALARPVRLLAASLALLGAAQPALAHVQDGFSRADSATLGNGWIEKNAAAFTLAADRAAKQAVTAGYRDNVAYRPASEDVLNVEAAVEVQFASMPPGYPQVLVRVQSATVATADVLDGYMLYVPDNANQAILGRQNAGAFVTTLATLNLTSALNTTDRFRLRLSATGTNPVLLDAYVERLGANGVWTTIGQASASDASAQRIATAGSVGFSGYIEGTYAFDNFTRVDLGAVGTTNPAPTVASLAPSSAAAGEGDLIVVVYGTGFTTDSVVRWNGANRTTTYVSPTELEAVIPAANLASAGTANVSVSNPTPGGGVSGNLTFTINNPGPVAPTITSLSPSSATAGGPAFTLTVNGAGYNSGSVVRWNGANRTTTFVSATQLTAAITAADIASASTAAVTVFRASDGMTSTATNFAVNAPAGADFTDSFDRANGDSIGNGWVEKTPAAFNITSNQAAKVGAGDDYRNNIVYRPAGENLGDVEASVELRVQSLPVGYPQVMVRIQTGTVAPMGQLDAYLMYLPDSASQAVIARQRGTSYDQPLVTFNLSSAINTTDLYRLRLRATGTNPVALQGFVERFSSGAWQVLGQATFNDAAADRISGAGSVGFAGYIETNYRYDNFRRVNLATTAPAPTVSSLSPSSRTAGSGAFSLTVNGAGFTGNSVVRWNGADRTTTFVSATQLTAAINAADVASQGSANVTVFTPAPGGGTSGAASFSITAPASNPVPTATSLAPSSANAGDAAFTLTVNGSNFVAGSVVRWDGADRATTFVSATQLTASITAADIASQGARNVSVFNPTPGGGTSGSLTFTINAPGNNPVPVVTSLSPSSTAAGGAAFTLTVNGSSFVSGAIVRWNGSNRSTTFVSSTQLTASISASDIASQGTRTVTVFNPTPGGGASGGQTFTISAPQTNAPLPVLTSMSPGTWPTGGGAFTLNVTGSSFTPSSVVHWNGSARPTTVISANQLQASITSGDVSSAGVPSVTVVTPAPGGGRSQPLTFFVQSGSIQYFYDSFNRADNATVGNNWTEKNPNAFSILNNELPSIGPTQGFQQDIMYRPASEARLDMESSIEFRRLTNGTDLYTTNWPQVHARVQTNTVTFPFTLDSYIFFIEELGAQPRAMFAITASPTIGSRNECYIQQLPLPAPLVTGERYRLRFRVTGTSPVNLWGAVDQLVNGAWSVLASGTATHANNTVRDPNLYCDEANLPPPITNPGVAGTAKWTNRTDTYDNFYVRDVTPLPAAPTVSTLSPSSAAAGSSGFTLDVNGTNFTSDSTIRWNGATRSTQFISSTQLRTTLTSADLALSGPASVTVVNSSGSSSQLVFSVQPNTGTVSLEDGFNRANNAAIGNNWIEKTAAAFTLDAGTALKVASANGDYRNNIVIRPAAEDRRDAEALMEFRARSLPIGYPTLLARVQQSTAMTNNGFEGYLLFLDDSETVVLARQGLGAFETRLASFNMSQPLTVNGTYRMRLSAVGDAPVVLQASIERLDSNGVWAAIGQTSFNDSSGQRIATPGSVGFGGYIEAAYSFDNFRRVNLGSL